jgi:hypothetical protein
MKQARQWSLSVTALLALLAVSALAQDEAENIKRKLVAEAQAKIEITKMMGTQFGFETKVVKGAPYSAIAESETIQMLADGNRIRNKTTTTVYRDGEGRTRREVAGKMPGVAAEVFISDPVSGVNYLLDAQRRIGVKSPANESAKLVLEKRLAEKRLATEKAAEKVRTGELPVTINVDGQPKRLDQLTAEERASAEKKLQAAKETNGEMNASAKPATGLPRKKWMRPGTTESLGQQTMEGVLCEGTRTTVTIPANSIGNDLPINIVSEEWYAPELQALVLTKHSDPRNGETIYRLTNINRSEPDRALFEVPADYTVRENKMPVKTKPTKEE